MSSCHSVVSDRHVTLNFLYPVDGLIHYTIISFSFLIQNYSFLRSNFLKDGLTSKHEHLEKFKLVDPQSPFLTSLESLHKAIFSLPLSKDPERSPTSKNSHGHNLLQRFPLARPLYSLTMCMKFKSSIWVPQNSNLY